MVAEVVVEQHRKGVLIQVVEGGVPGPACGMADGGRRVSNRGSPQWPGRSGSKMARRSRSGCGVGARQHNGSSGFIDPMVALLPAHFHRNFLRPRLFPRLDYHISYIPRPSLPRTKTIDLSISLPLERPPQPGAVSPAKI